MAFMQGGRPSARALVAVTAVAALAALVVAAVGTVPAAAQATTIDSCTVVDSPGSYRLAGDLAGGTDGPCIEITASDVVLDGAGHTIAGPEVRTVDSLGDSNDGIYAHGTTEAPLTNVTVADLTTVGFDNGTHFENLDGGEIRGVTARRTVMNAIMLDAADGNRVVDSRIVNNSETPETDLPGAARGLYVSGSANNAIENVTLRDNKYSLLFDGGSTDNRARNVTSIRNVYDTYLFAADNNTITDMTSRENVRYAVYAEKNATGNRFVRIDMDTATVSFEPFNVAVRSIPSPTTGSVPPDPVNRQTIGQYVEARSTTAPPFSLSLTAFYRNVDIGDVDEESTITMSRYNNTGNGSAVWSRVEGASVDTGSNAVDTGEIPGNGPYGYVGAFDQVGVFAPTAAGDASDPPGQGLTPARTDGPPATNVATPVAVETTDVAGTAAPDAATATGTETTAANGPVAAGTTETEPAAGAEPTAAATADADGAATSPVITGPGATPAAVETDDGAATAIDDPGTGVFGPGFGPVVALAALLAVALLVSRRRG
jgi:PGF-CTERM protein